MLIRSEIKEALVLLVFSGLMAETLNVYTLGLVVLGVIMIIFEKRPSKVVRNIVTVAIFALYWMIYGKVIDPEVGINFLTSIILLKLIEKESVRDHYMIFFGLVLLISAGSLFEKSLSYVFFFAASFILLILDFYKNLKIPMRVSNLLQSLLWVLPLASLMFFLVPRMMNPFQLGNGPPKAGEIGYTPEVNISEIERLVPNDTAVFQAALERPIAGSELYWRGNTLIFSDGWNWPVMPQDRIYQNFISQPTGPSPGIKQSIRTFSKQEFFFGLDAPSSIKSAKGEVELGATRTLSQNSWQPTPRYEVITQIDDSFPFEGDKDAYLRSGLKRDEKAWIEARFKEVEFASLVKEIQNHFQTNSFIYSLSPGKVVGFLDFMQKKVGFCSHYASAVGMILRTKKIPVRLVSGFLGGSYNRYAGFYLVTQNDAHVWVEAQSNGSWVRLDPTEWIAPDRIKLGAEAFMAQTNPESFSVFNKYKFNNFGFIRDWQQWFSQWDFKFYQWLEDMDYYGQEALFDKFKFQKRWLFSLIPLLVAVFLGLYVWSMGLRRKRYSETELLWRSFQSKMKKRGVILRYYSVVEIEELLTLGEKEAYAIWKDLIEVSFRPDSVIDIRSLKRKIKML